MIRLIFAVFLLTVVSPAYAQFSFGPQTNQVSIPLGPGPFVPAGPGGGGGGSGSSYIGPGDVQSSGWTAYWGLRAFSNAKAVAGVNAATIRRTSDSTTTTIKVLSSGAFDAATASTFCTATTCFITELYDQTGNGNNLTQSTTSQQPQLFFNCIGSLPCMSFAGGSTQYLIDASFSQANPWSMIAAAERTSQTSSYNTMLGGGTATNPNLSFSPSATDVNGGGSTGNISIAGLTESSWHACQLSNTGSSTSEVICDSTSNTGNIGSAAISEIALGYNVGATSNPLYGNMVEAGIGTFGVETAVLANIQTYWNFGACSNSLNFAQACNSQYIAMGIP